MQVLFSQIVKHLVHSNLHCSVFCSLSYRKINILTYCFDFSGLVSTLSRIVIGFIADLPCISRVYLCNLLLMANGLFLVLSPFCFNYASYLAFGILFGFTAGTCSVNCSKRK